MLDSAQAVVLLSGGIDSTVLLHRVAGERGGASIHALSFDYGQRHRRELACAEAQAAAVGVASYRSIDISFLGDLLRAGSTLIAGGEAVPDLSGLDEEALTQPPTYVPNRNMMLLSMAAAYAEAQGIHDLFYGAQAQDEYGYWDCTTDFLRAINATLALNRREAVTVHAPLIAASKADNVREGLALDVNFGETWSCYRGGTLACGSCPTCVERLNAFAAVGVNDPLSYESA